MRQLLRFATALIAAIHRLFFASTQPPGNWIPAVIDEVEVFEGRLMAVLPHDWTIERTDFRPWSLYYLNSPQPYLDDWDRAWVLSTPWTGHEPQRAQVHLYLLRDAPSIPSHKEVLTRWGRFAVAAQDPAAIQIGNDSFTWGTLPGWTDAKADMISALS